MILLLKILAIVLITLSCGGFGFLKAEELSAKVKELTMLGDFLCDIKENIRYSATPANKLLENLKEKYAVIFSSKNKDTNSILDEFISSFGTSDISGQISLCDNLKSKLDIRLDFAKKEAMDKGKIYKTLGLLGGLAFSITII